MVARLSYIFHDSSIGRDPHLLTEMSLESHVRSTATPPKLSHLTFARPT